MPHPLLPLQLLAQAEESLRGSRSPDSDPELGVGYARRSLSHNVPPGSQGAAPTSDLLLGVQDRVQKLSELARDKLSLRSGQEEMEGQQHTGSICSPRTTTPGGNSTPWFRPLARLLLPPRMGTCTNELLEHKPHVIIANLPLCKARVLK